MPAAVLLAGDDAHVDRVVGCAQAHLADALPLGLQLFAHERGDERAVERPDVVDDSFRKAFVGAGDVVVLARYVGDGETTAVEPLNAPLQSDQDVLRDVLGRILVRCKTSRPPPDVRLDAI